MKCKNIYFLRLKTATLILNKVCTKADGTTMRRNEGGVIIGLIGVKWCDRRHSPHVIFLDVLGVHSHHLRVCATQGDSFTQTQVRNTGGSIHTTDGGAGCNMAIRQLAKEEAAQILRRSLI